MHRSVLAAFAAWAALVVAAPAAAQAAPDDFDPTFSMRDTHTFTNFADGVDP